MQSFNKANSCHTVFPSSEDPCIRRPMGCGPYFLEHWLNMSDILGPVNKRILAIKWSIAIKAYFFSQP